jgi:hypothetical protein
MEFQAACDGERCARRHGARAVTARAHCIAAPSRNSSRRCCATEAGAAPCESRGISLAQRAFFAGHGIAATGAGQKEGLR